MIRPMRLFKRPTGIYYVELARGKARSLKTKDKAQAQGIFRAMEREYLRGRLLQLDTRRMSISEFADHYEEHRPGVSKWTLKKDLLSLKLLREAVGDLQMRAITQTRIDQFKNVCLARKAKPQTVNGYLRHIKGALSYAIEDNIIDKKPKVKMIREDKTALAERIISPDNLKAIIEAAHEKDPAFARFLTLALWTGGRRREVLGMAWQDVDLDGQRVLFTKTKGKQDRRVPLLPAALVALEPHKKDIGRVFPNWHPDTASKWFHSVAASVGVKARLHDLRHSVATYMLASGIPVQVVKEILGHAHLSTTLLYSHNLDEATAREMQKLRFE